MIFNKFCCKCSIFYLVKLLFFVLYFVKNDDGNSVVSAGHLLFFIEACWLISTLKLLCAMVLSFETEMIISRITMIF